jgi:hypothetical protein
MKTNKLILSKLGRQRWATFILLGALVTITAQLYSVRELLVAELLFAIGLVSFLAFAGACYFLGALGEYGWKWSEVEGQKVLNYSRRMRMNMSVGVLPPHPTGRPSPP